MGPHGGYVRIALPRAETVEMGQKTTLRVPQNVRTLPKRLAQIAVASRKRVELVAYVDGVERYIRQVGRSGDDIDIVHVGERRGDDLEQRLVDKLLHRWNGDRRGVAD